MTSLLTRLRAIAPISEPLEAALAERLKQEVLSRKSLLLRPGFSFSKKPLGGSPGGFFTEGYRQTFA